MGRIHVLSENVANKIAAERWSSVQRQWSKSYWKIPWTLVTTRIRINIEAGGKKLIQITDNGCGMVRDDALLAFETPRDFQNQKRRRPVERSDAWLSRRAYLPRLRLPFAPETRAPKEASGTVIEIRRQDISAKAKRRYAQTGLRRFLILGSRVAFEGQQSVVAHHAAAVVGNLGSAFCRPLLC